MRLSHLIDRIRVASLNPALEMRSKQKCDFSFDKNPLLSPCTQDTLVFLSLAVLLDPESRGFSCGHRRTRRLPQIALPLPPPV